MSTQQSSEAPESAGFPVPHLPKIPFPHVLPQIAFINCEDTQQAFIDKFGTVPDIFLDMLKKSFSEVLPKWLKHLADNATSEGGISKEEEETIDTNGLSLDPLKWFGFHRFDARKGQLPDLGHEKYDCIIIGGSSSANVNEPVEWVRKLSNIILDARSKDIRLIGISFGHKLISKVLYDSLLEVDESSWWDIGPQEVELNPKFSPLFNGAKALSSEMFQKGVVVLGRSCFPTMDPPPPLNSENTWSLFGPVYLGTVTSTTNRDGRSHISVLTMQGRPEITGAMAELLLDLFSRPGGEEEAIPADVVEKAKERMKGWHGVLDWVRMAAAIWAVVHGTPFKLPS